MSLNATAGCSADIPANSGREVSPKSAPAWQVEVDRASAADWSRMLSLFDDANIYQTAAYGAVRWAEKNLSRLVLKRDGEVVAIAQLRIMRPTPLKFGIAYLRWGPLWERRGHYPDPEVHARMAAAIADEYVTKRKLLLRIIPNAFAGTARAVVMQTAFIAFRQEPLVFENTYRTFVVDLAPHVEDLRKGLDKKWRNQLTRAEKNNLEVTAGTGTDEYQAFCRIYHEMRGRKSFETTVDVEEFGRMQEMLPESQRMRILICKDKDIPVAGVVASAMGDSAIYLLGATSADGLNSKGAYLLHWTLIQWLKEKGIRWYDLGGIDPDRNPGVYHFKRGFSGADVSQLGPFVASRSAVGSAVVNAAFAVQRVLRRFSHR
jgi:lipid II:glycine glycyltransferase (peptidoglycan interpeptide bridge formation enzyme)